MVSWTLKLDLSCSLKSSETMSKAHFDSMKASLIWSLGNTMRHFQKTSIKRLREIEQTFNEKMISFDDEVSFQ